MLMAPPIPGLLPPRTGRPRRTRTDVLLGIGATILLLVIVVGIPVAMATVLRPSLPKLSGSSLTHQLDATAILHVLEFLIIPIWLVLVWSVLVEIRAALANRDVQARQVPVAGSIAHRLVGAALLMFTAAAALTPAFSHSAPPRPAYTVSQMVHGTPDQQKIGSILDQFPATTAVQHTQTTTGKMYVVQPPQGRYHESLWEIAQKHLGDGRRYKEIFELNKDRVQPDGTKLTIASLIRPGWVLHMPRDAAGPGIEVVAQALHTPPGHEAQAPPRQQTQTSSGIPGQAGDFSNAASNAAHDQQWPFELASASLMAAGVLVALGRQRREQLWRRAFGRRIAAPHGDAALAEQAFRLGADDPAVRMLDLGLRNLSQQLAAQHRPLPTVFAAHVGTENLDLWIATPDPNPPRPWLAADGGQVWRLPVSAVAGLEPGGTLAPYPGLVSLGTNPTGRVLVDLEVAQGLIAVRGPGNLVQAALAAFAVELVTNLWSDKMHVTLVGFGEGLQPISAERLSVLPTLDEALPLLEARAAELNAAMAASGIDSVLTGRANSTDPGLWAPHYLITGVPPAPGQAERLTALARGRHRMATGFVVAGEIPDAAWTWEVSQDGRVRADALGFDLVAQLLGPHQYRAIVDLFRPDPGGVPLGPLGAGNAPAAQLVPGARMPVEIGLLGPATVQAPGALEPDRLAIATELVVFLAAHPAGVHLNVLSGAVWPRGVPAEVRDATLTRTSAWLGSGPSGEPNLQADPSGRLFLGPGVRVDWLVFRALMNRASQAAAAADTNAETAQLEQALAMVRGQFLDGRDPARYAWLATDDVEYEVTALVADAAHRLSSLRLAAGDASAAMDAARAGLRLAFNDEMLWRDLLIAAHATGKEGVLRAAVSELEARVALDEVMPRMAPETEALIDELLPSWRTSAA
jgi:Bacterial transcriptional activator domain